MFKLIKWLLFLTLLIALVYGVNFFMSLDDVERLQAKKDAIEAIDTGEATALTGPLSLKMKEDLQKKKTNFFIIAKEKLKKAVNFLFGESN